jgi:hypothetical protein
VYRCDGPLVAEAVTDGQECNVADAVVVREHVVARFARSLPSVEVATTDGIPVPRFRPPIGRSGDDGNERQWLVGGDGATMRYIEFDRRGLFDDRQREAPGVESETLAQPGGALAELVARTGGGS